MNEFISWKSAVAPQLVLGSSVGTDGIKVGIHYYQL